MLFIDIIDIIYFAIGIAVGAMLTTLVDYMMCKECMNQLYKECVEDFIKEFEEGELTNE